MLADAAISHIENPLGPRQSYLVPYFLACCGCCTRVPPGVWILISSADYYLQIDIF